MTDFTTRPEIRGTFGAVTSTHWIASAAGMAMLERGGNAFDAAVAAGLVLQVVEPHLNGPGGDLPAIFKTADGQPQVLCAQGPAPKAAVPEAFGAHQLIPGSGLLATVVPGAFDGWMRLLADHGSLPLAEVMAPAIFYAREGHPALARVSATIAGLKDFFAAEWPSSAAVWTPGGEVPAPDSLMKNPDLAATWQRILDEAQGAGGDRVVQIEAARAIWSDGFVADAITEFVTSAEPSNNIGGRDRALLARDDLSGWRASVEAPLSIDYHGWTVFKTGPWGQGPVLLQALAVLRDIDLAAMDPLGADFVHTVIEAMKLAYADREAYYGDPDFYDIPMGTLLSAEYAAERRALIGPQASREQRPGRVPGHEALADAAIARAARDFAAGPSVEPTMAHLTHRRGRAAPVFHAGLGAARRVHRRHFRHDGDRRWNGRRADPEFPRLRYPQGGRHIFGHRLPDRPARCDHLRRNRPRSARPAAAVAGLRQPVSRGHHHPVVHLDRRLRRPTGPQHRSQAPADGVWRVPAADLAAHVDRPADRRTVTGSTDLLLRREVEDDIGRDGRLPPERQLASALR